MQNKPIIYYRPESLSYVSRFHEGFVASIMVEGKWMMTSEIIEKNPDGTFETSSFIYMPKKESNDHTTN